MLGNVKVRVFSKSRIKAGIKWYEFMPVHFDAHNAKVFYKTIE